MAGNWISSDCLLEMRHSGPAQWCSLSMSICGLCFLDTSVDSFEMVERKKHHKPKLPLSRSLMSPLVLIEDLFLVCYLSEVTRFTYFRQQSPHLNHLAFIQSFVYLSQSLNMKSCLLICCWPLFKWGKGNQIWTSQASSYFPFPDDSNKQIWAKSQMQKKFFKWNTLSFLLSDMAINQ